MLEPVQGAITSKSNIFFGPIGSAWFISRMTLFPVTFSKLAAITCAGPTRVSVRATFSEIIGMIFAPSAITRSISLYISGMVQNEPVIAQPIVFPLNILRPFLLYDFIYSFFHDFCGSDGEMLSGDGVILALFWKARLVRGDI